MPHEQTAIRTRTGLCPARGLTLRGEGPWQTVIFCMDDLGIRPASVAMARSLADAGYLDMYYRCGPSRPYREEI